jgi:3-mercaptopyruvate sulfurtransferase SseA
MRHFGRDAITFSASFPSAPRDSSWTCARPSQAANEDGTFKSADALRQLYESKGITGQDEVIAYCRIGERSSHTWFVLRYLLGYEKVRNYDGSWTEWGNLVGAPIEKGIAAAAH